MRVLGSRKIWEEERWRPPRTHLCARDSPSHTQRWRLQCETWFSPPHSSRYQNLKKTWKCLHVLSPPARWYGNNAPVGVFVVTLFFIVSLRIQSAQPEVPLMKKWKEGCQVSVRQGLIQEALGGRGGHRKHKSPLVCGASTIFFLSLARFSKHENGNATVSLISGCSISSPHRMDSRNLKTHGRNVRYVLPPQPYICSVHTDRPNEFKWIYVISHLDRTDCSIVLNLPMHCVCKRGHWGRYAPPPWPDRRSTPFERCFALDALCTVTPGQSGGCLVVDDSLLCESGLGGRITASFNERKICQKDLES